MRKCKRCKTKEAVIGSLNCKKCNDRNTLHTANFVENLRAAKSEPNCECNSNANYGAYGGLGSEWDTGIAGHLENM